MSSNVLITGATSGVGLALARRLGDRASLLLTGTRPVAEITAALPAASAYIAADQRHPETAASIILEELSRLGWEALDLAILNAGAGFALDPADETPEAIRTTLDVNLFSAIALAHGLFPRLEKARGKLILIGSTAHKGAPGFASYAASKAGLGGFARALAEEWRGRVSVQIIHPGPTATDMHAKAGYDPGRLGKYFISPDRMAAMIEQVMSGRRSPVTASYTRYLASGLWLGIRA